MESKRIVIKVGSNVLTRADGNPDITNMSSLVDQMAALRNMGHQIILVSSGAVACGRGAITSHRNLNTVEARQLFSSIGQIRLLNIYSSLFLGYGITVGQVLTQKDNFSSRDAYLNQRNCMLVMLENGVLPIVNENDTASLTELMFTDNDELSGLVATMLDADMLIILSNVDGIYDGNPSLPGSRIIERISRNDDVTSYVVSTKSGFGRGGMGSKCGIARRVAEEGIPVIIARGTRPGVLVDLVNNVSGTPHTIFEPSPQPISNIKRWIAHSGNFAKGIIYVDDVAARALRSDTAVSLLPVGVVSIDGEWEEGDIVTLATTDGTTIGYGRASINSDTTLSTIGQKGARCIVHYDYMYIE